MDLYGWEGSARDTWQAVTNTLLDECWQQAEMDAVAPAALASPLPLSAQVVISGLVIMADWIASNTALFPLGTATDDRAQTGIDSLALPRPWSPTVPPADPAALLASRFDIFSKFEPRPFQTEAIAVARAMESPGLMILEAAPEKARLRLRSLPRRCWPQSSSAVASSLRCQPWPLPMPCSAASWTGWVTSTCTISLSDRPFGWDMGNVASTESSAGSREFSCPASTTTIASSRA